jgi:hypothetical protein
MILFCLSFGDSCLQSDLDFAKELSRLSDLWKDGGVISVRTHYLIQLDVLDMRLCARDIDELSYCNEKLDVIEAVKKIPIALPLMKDSYMQAGSVQGDQGTLIRHIIETRNKCQGQASFLDITSSGE